MIYSTFRYLVHLGEIERWLCCKKESGSATVEKKNKRESTMAERQPFNRCHPESCVKVCSKQRGMRASVEDEISPGILVANAPSQRQKERRLWGVLACSYVTRGGCK